MRISSIILISLTLGSAFHQAGAENSGSGERVAVLLRAGSFASVEQALSDGWEAWSQREEIRPDFFVFDPDSANGRGFLGIGCGSNPFSRGGWRRFVGGVEPGRHYRLEATFSTKGVSFPRQKALARLDWLRSDSSRIHPPVYVSEQIRHEGGRRMVGGTFPAPGNASAVRVELLLGHSPGGSVWWEAVELSAVPASAGRPVRLAAVYHRPRNTQTSAESVEEFCRVLEKAGEMSCDIVCLGEVVNRIGLSGVSFPDIAEPIPGPSTRRLGEVARRHNMYVVAGISERDGPAVYSSAVLIGRGGEVEGVYRRVYLSEIHTDQGVSPGDSYPVFDTDFGRIGIMTGYDSWSPDPARELAAQGAEIIFLPVWGDNEAVIRARAIENHVFLVLAAYDNVSRIFDPWGELLAEAGEQPSLAVADIDLDYPPPCPFSYPQPDMRLRMLHERRLDIPSPLLEQESGAEKPHK